MNCCSILSACLKDKAAEKCKDYYPACAGKVHWERLLRAIKTNGIGPIPPFTHFGANQSNFNETSKAVPLPKWCKYSENEATWGLQHCWCSKSDVSFATSHFSSCCTSTLKGRMNKLFLPEVQAGHQLPRPPCHPSCPVHSTEKSMLWSSTEHGFTDFCSNTCRATKHREVLDG